MKWGVDKCGSNPQTYMVKVLGRFDPYNPISYIFCYKIVLMFFNGTRVSEVGLINTKINLR